MLAVVEEFERRLLSGELPGRGELRTADDLERWFGDFVAFQHATGATRGCLEGMASRSRYLSPSRSGRWTGA